MWQVLHTHTLLSNPLVASRAGGGEAVKGGGIEGERNRDRKQCFGSVFIFSGSGSGSRGWGWRPVRIQGFNDQKLEKNYSWKKNLIFFLSKTAIYLSLGLHKVCPSYRKSLQLSKEAIQHFKTWTFTNFFLLLWVIFGLLDPDPDSESGSGSTGPIEYRSNPDTDPDPKPWQEKRESSREGERNWDKIGRI